MPLSQFMVIEQPSQRAYRDPPSSGGRVSIRAARYSTSMGRACPRMPLSQFMVIE